MMTNVSRLGARRRVTVCGKCRTPISVNLIGCQDIADMLEVRPNTVNQWRYRDTMPPPLAMVSGTPIWERETIRQWALDTGRIKSVDL